MSLNPPIKPSEIEVIHRPKQKGKHIEGKQPTAVENNQFEINEQTNQALSIKADMTNKERVEGLNRYSQWALNPCIQTRNIGRKKIEEIIELGGPISLNPFQTRYGISFLIDDQYENAISNLSQVKVHENGNEINAKTHLGLAHLLNNDLNSAIHHFEEVIAIATKSIPKNNGKIDKRLLKSLKKELRAALKTLVSIYTIQENHQKIEHYRNIATEFDIPAVLTKEKTKSPFHRKLEQIIPNAERTFQLVAPKNPFENDIFTAESAAEYIEHLYFNPVFKSPFANHQEIQIKAKNSLMQALEKHPSSYKLQELRFMIKAHEGDRLSQINELLPDQEAPEEAIHIVRQALFLGCSAIENDQLESALKHFQLAETLAKKEIAKINKLRSEGDYASIPKPFHSILISARKAIAAIEGKDKSTEPIKNIPESFIVEKALNELRPKLPEVIASSPNIKPKKKLPQNIKSCLDSALYLARNDRTDDAIQLIEEELIKNPNQPNLLLILTCLKIQDGQLEIKSLRDKIIKEIKNKEIISLIYNIENGNISLPTNPTRTLIFLYSILLEKATNKTSGSLARILVKLATLNFRILNDQNSQENIEQTLHFLKKAQEIDQNNNPNRIGLTSFLKSLCHIAQDDFDSAHETMHRSITFAEPNDISGALYLFLSAIKENNKNINKLTATKLFKITINDPEGNKVKTMIDIAKNLMMAHNTEGQTSIGFAKQTAFWRSAKNEHIQGINKLARIVAPTSPIKKK